MEIFSARLKWSREQKGLTQKEVAEKIGMTQSSYSKYEYGLREPNLETLSKLPAVLDVSVDFILGVTDYDKDVNELVNKMYAESDELKFIVRNIDKGTQFIDMSNPESKAIAESRLFELSLRAEHKRNAINHYRNLALQRLQQIPFVSEKTIHYIETYDPFAEEFKNQQ